MSAHSKVFVFLAAVVASAALAEPAFEGVDFTAEIGQGAPSGGTRAVDLDGDGDLDIVGLGFWYERVAGSGYVEHPIPVLAEFDIADLNSDGHPDIIGIANNRDTAWLRSDGASPPSFTLATIFSRDVVFGGSSLRSVCVADFNADGRIDIVTSVPSITAGATVYHRNLGGGTIPGFTNIVIAGTVGVLADGDLDGDGDLDFIHIREGERNRWYENNGSAGAFFNSRTIPDPIAEAESQQFMGATVGDLDGDGDTDIVVSYFSSGEIVCYDNDGAVDPAFTRRVLVGNYNPGVRSEIRVCDIDADGDQDVLSERTSQIVDLFIQQDLPLTFVQHAIESPNSAQGRGTQPVDFDSDGDLDLLVGFPHVQMQREAFNLTTGEAAPGLSTILKSVSPGDEIQTFGSLFAPLCLPELRVDVDGITIFNLGPVTLESSSEVVIGGDTTLVPSDFVLTTGDFLEIRSPLTLNVSKHLNLGTPTDVSVDEYNIIGPVTMHTGSELTSFTSLNLIGAPNLQRTKFAPSVRTLNCVAAADAEGDGDLDLFAVTDVNDDGVFLYESTGGVSPEITQRIIDLSVPDNNSSHEIAVGDLEGDGDPDVVVLSRDGTVTVLTNDGLAPAGFVASTVSQAAGESFSLALADIDGDEDLDILFARDRDAYFVHENLGGSPATFASRVVANTAGSSDDPRVIIVSDIDGDGDIDLITSSFRSNSSVAHRIAWHRNDGGTTPVFTRIQLFQGSEEICRALHAADLDGDEDTDLAAVVGDRLIVFANDGAAMPGFTPFEQATNLVSPSVIRSVDLDLDGELDLIVGSAANNLVTWHQNLGSPTPAFVQRAIDDRFDSFPVLVVEDFDGDGDTDLLTTSNNGEEDRVAINLLENIISLTFDMSSPGVVVASMQELSLLNRAVQIGATSELSASGVISVDRSSEIAGNGTASASVLASAGSIRPEAGETLTVAGAYVQRYDDGIRGPLTGRVLIDLADGTAPTALAITGDADLAGGLFVSSDAPIDPATPGVLSEVLTASSITGRFDIAFFPAVTTDASGGGRFMRLQYESALLGGGASVSIRVDSLTGQIATDPAEVFDVNGQPAAAAVGDLNNDGLLDLALALPDPVEPGSDDGSVVVLFNAGSSGGTWLGFTGNAEVMVGADPSGIAIGEADLSGGLDIAVTNRADNTLMIITNDGLGMPASLVVAQTIPVGSAPSAVAFGELDEDKWDDIAVANFGSDNVTVLQNMQGIGVGWMGVGMPQTIPSGDGPVDLIFGELDEDKWDDIAIANGNDGTVTYLDNTFPPGNFAPPLVLGSDDGSSDLACEDLDGDGIGDLIVSNPGSDTVSIILNNGNSTFEPVVNLPIAGAPRSVAAVDLDDDQDADLAVITDDGFGATTVRVLRNDLTDGQLSFSPDEDIDSGGSPVFVLAADVDNDGQGDLVTVNATGGARGVSGESGAAAMPIGVVRQTATTCPGDCDGSGAVDFNDLVSMLFEFGAETPPLGCDVDGSSAVDFNDLVAALFVFGVCE